jgi:hypothetical protein
MKEIVTWNDRIWNIAWQNTPVKELDKPLARLSGSRIFDR